jgi:hypothetical protein
MLVPLRLMSKPQKRNQKERGYPPVILRNRSITSAPDQLNGFKRILLKSLRSSSGDIPRLTQWIDLTKMNKIFGSSRSGFLLPRTPFSKFKKALASNLHDGRPVGREEMLEVSFC